MSDINSQPSVRKKNQSRKNIHERNEKYSVVWRAEKTNPLEFMKRVVMEASGAYAKK